MAKKQFLGKFEFNTKKALTEKVREILHGHKPGEYLEGENLELISLLVERHPNAKEKIGVGIETIKVIYTDVLYKGATGFALVRKDGSQEIFSYRKCLSPVNLTTEFKKAARRTIQSYSEQERQKFFQKYGSPCFCPLTGEEMEYSTSHIDHKAPFTFNKIFDLFIKQEGIEINGDFLENTEEGITFKCEVLKKKWVDFHDDYATLRVIHKDENMRLGNK